MITGTTIILDYNIDTCNITSTPSACYSSTLIISAMALLLLLHLCAARSFCDLADEVGTVNRVTLLDRQARNLSTERC